MLDIRNIGCLPLWAHSNTLVLRNSAQNISEFFSHFNCFVIPWLPLYLSDII
jgi:hypothetical protein